MGMFWILVLLIGIEEYLLTILLISCGAGFLGSLIGIGGGVIIVPVLTIVYGIPLQYALGASIISVIATSSGSASAYLREKITNLRIGTFLLIATTFGAVLGAIATLSLIRSGFEWLILFVFGFVLIYSSYNVYKKGRAGLKSNRSLANQEPNQLAELLDLKGEYYDEVRRENVTYEAAHVIPGFSVMFIAGIFSGLLGIGSGALKVLGMDTLMKLPFKVSTTTSNLMIGVTAVASAGIYYIQGFINPLLAAPIAFGVVLGSIVGTKILVRSKPSSLRFLFVIILLVLGLEMIQRGLQRL
ncbi:MAG: sulfite exporter TauE/SafE family protein [Nitrososphaerales archaeon]